MQSYFHSSEYELFFLSVEIAAALWVHIQSFEVTFRSFIHEVLSNYSTNSFWFEGSRLLSKRDRTDIQRIRSRYRLQDSSAEEIVEHLSLSFWVELCSARYYEKIWRKMEEANPLLKGKRRDFYNKAREIRNLRNSIAHHGPIMRRNLIRDHSYLGELTAILDPELAREVEKRSRVLDLLLNARLVGSGGGI